MAHANGFADAALSYAKHNWRVVPLRPRDKAPRIADWTQAASCDPTVIAAWWDQVPNGNVGVAVGSGSGLVAIDIDSAEGEELLRQLSAGDCPVTVTMATAKGRRLIYRIPDALETEPRTVAFRGQGGSESLRFQGAGAQFVAPPSIHPSGTIYTWAPGHSPADMDAAPMPGWLIAAMCGTEMKESETTRTRTETYSTWEVLPRVDYNRRHGSQFLDILLSDGWKIHRRHGDRVELTRPGKADGCSATLGFKTCDESGAPLLFVFSSSVAFLKPLAFHCPFAFFAVVHHGGDWAAAHAALVDKGYGHKKPQQWVSVNWGCGTASAPPAGETSGDAPPTPPEPEWPAPLADEAFHGPVGAFVRAVEPATEADPAGILVQALVAVGNLLGRHCYTPVEADRHHPNLFTVLVGRSSRGRKGTSLGYVREPLADVDPGWADDRVTSGLSSGEGLIAAVRDPTRERVEEPDGAGGVVTRDEVTDPGAADKRLLVVEPEFATVLKQTERSGNILSAVVRDAWDRGRLSTLTKSNPVRASDAHVSVIGHITAEELRRGLSATEVANGFGNRFLFVCVKRSKLLPDGGRVDRAALERFRDRVRAAVRFASEERRVVRDPAAAEVWRGLYGELTRDTPGVAGALTARSEAHVTRLSLIYALLDSSEVIRVEHLAAAVGVWDFCARSVRHVFGDSLGDPLADALLRLLRGRPAGTTRNDICNHLGRNQPGDLVARALGLLLQHGLAHRRPVPTGGRPAETWFPGPGEASLVGGVR